MLPPPPRVARGDLEEENRKPRNTATDSWDVARASGSGGER